MFRCRNLIVCYFIFSIAPLAHGAETINHPGPYCAYSSEMQRVNPELLYDLDEAAYARMTLEDSLLKLAYRNVFTKSTRDPYAQSSGKFLNSEPAEAPALADMRRRGDAVTPMLLKLLDENQETGFEISLLGKVDQVGTITLDPYLAYARSLLRERTQTMSANAAAVASLILARYGSKADPELLRQVLEERPYVADDVTRSLGMLEQRLNPPEQKARPPLRERLPAGGATTDSAANGGQKPSAVKSRRESSPTFWIAWGLFIAAVAGMLWVLLKKGFRRGGA